jgi:hypothetical protein
MVLGRPGRSPLQMRTPRGGVRPSTDANKNGRWDGELGGTGTSGWSETDPNNADSDGHCTQDGTEQGLTEPAGDDTDLDVFVPDGDPATTTDPLETDSDDGSAGDGQEDPTCDDQIATARASPTTPMTTCPRSWSWRAAAARGPAARAGCSRCRSSRSRSCAGAGPASTTKAHEYPRPSRGVIALLKGMWRDARRTPRGRARPRGGEDPKASLPAPGAPELELQR